MNVERNLLTMGTIRQNKNVQKWPLMMVAAISCFLQNIQSGSVDAVKIRIQKVGLRIQNKIGKSIMFIRKTCIQVT